MVSNDDCPSTLPGQELPDELSDVTVPAPDELFEALADATRRQVAWHLESEPEATADELVDAVVDERVADTETADADARDRVALSLRHVHLPRLDDAGLVDFDADAGTVSLEPLPQDVHNLVRFGYDYEQTAGGGYGDSPWE